MTAMSKDECDHEEENMNLFFDVLEKRDLDQLEALIFMQLFSLASRILRKRDASRFSFFVLNVCP